MKKCLIDFPNLEFRELKEGKIEVVLLKQFYFYLDKKKIEKISPFKIKKKAILFFSDEKLNQEVLLRKFNFLLQEGLNNLKNKLTHNPAIYLHQNQNLPLIGHLAFGLIYRNTSLIEIKPSTGCNLNCIYCSVGEGLSSQKRDFLIEKTYLVREFKKLLDFIQEPIEAHINPQGEPFLYGDILGLVEELNKLPLVRKISIDTNATLLTKKEINHLTNLKKIRLNISLNSLNQKTATLMAGYPYPLKKVLEIIAYAQKKGVSLLLTPLLLPRYNDQEIEEIVEWAKKNKLKVALQNFLPYKTGRNPTKTWTWNKFYGFLKKLEKKHQVKLIYSSHDFGIKTTKKLEKPFHKGEIIQARIVFPDRFPYSCLAVARGRLISVSYPPSRQPKRKIAQIKLIRDKHNIFVGKLKN